MMSRKVLLFALLFVAQALCAFVFVYDVFAALIGLPYAPIPWEIREFLEIGAALGLVVGLILGGVLLRRALRQRHLAEDRLRRASTAFSQLLSERFEEWRLTPAERDVALFLIKGMSPAEIAGLRGAAEGTVKAQCNAIYKKAGVGGRFQLLSLFVDDLMQDIGTKTLAGSDGALNTGLGDKKALRVSS